MIIYIYSPSKCIYCDFVSEEFQLALMGLEEDPNLVTGEVNLEENSMLKEKFKLAPQNPYIIFYSDHE